MSLLVTHFMNENVTKKATNNCTHSNKTVQIMIFINLFLNIWIPIIFMF